MIFNEWIYFIGLFLASLGYNTLPRPFRPYLLLISGLLFYSYYAGGFVLLLLGEAIAIYYLLSTSKGRYAHYLVSLALAVLLLAWFKYRNLLMTGWEENDGLQELIVPLAISFFTFEFIHYIVDHKKGVLPKHNLAEYLAFIFFFPSMVAGPIKRMQQFLPDMFTSTTTSNDIREGGLRIIIGLCKKLIIADTMTLFSDQLLGQALSSATPLQIWGWTFAYAIKIYMDFSGYSDIAIGSARFFGIHIPENFNWPYLTRNISSFWKAWHMSLTSWIRDYIFIPLGGSRVALTQTFGNILVTMGICGLWHGAAWHFVGWGIYHGVLLGLYRCYVVFIPERFRNRMPQPLAIGITFVTVMVGWLFFILPVNKALFALNVMLGGWL